jgi:ABC-2 type transport system permease protein/sodium transport system permease protein
MSAGAGGFGRLLRLTTKELNETLRDRRTLLTLVLMPLLLYPLLALGFNTLLAARYTTGDLQPYRVAFRSREEKEALVPYLERGVLLLVKSGVMREPGGNVPLATPAISLDYRVYEDIDNAVLSGFCEVGIRPRDGGKSSFNLEVIYAEESALGQEAARYIRRLAEAANSLIMFDAIDKRFLPPLFRLAPTPVTLPGRHRPPPLLVLVPLVLILMTITGAVYPAIDLTAGERERGTLEVLMAAPVPRMSLLLAKYAAVLVVAMLTGLVNLVGMLLSIYLSGQAPRLLGEQGMSVHVVVEIFLLLLLFTSFFAALLLALASLARSFKEAQAYLVPLMVVALIPGMVSLVPTIRLDGPVAFIPLLNVVLLARDVFSGAAEVSDAVVVVGMTIIYALAAISLAAAAFGRDTLMAGPAGRGTPAKRQEITPGPPPVVQ